MARPYININSITYSSPTMSLNMTFFKLRGGGTFSISGLSNSVLFSQTHSNTQLAGGIGYRTIPVTVGSFGYPTDPTSTYVNPSIIFSVTGTSSVTNNAKVYINGITLSSVTASDSSLTNWLGGIANGFYSSPTLVSLFPIGSWTSSVSMTTATAGTIAFTPTNTGNYYNNNYNLTISGLVPSVSSISGTVVGSTTFSGGITNYVLTLTYPKLGGITSFIFSI